MSKSRHLPILVTIIVLVASFTFWIINYTSHENLAMSDLRRFTTDVADDTADAMSSRIKPVESTLIPEWEQYINETGEPDFKFFMQSIPPYFNMYQDFMAMNFINSTSHIKWVYPYERNKDAINKSVEYTFDGSFNTAFAKTKSTKTITLTNVIEFFQGGLGIVGYLPIVVKGEIEGYITIVTEIGSIFKNVFDGEHDDYYAFIMENTKIIYIRDEMFATGDRYVVESAISFYNINWKMFCQLSEHTQFEINPLLDIYILLIGFVCAGIVLYSTRVIERENEMELALLTERKNHEKMMFQYEKMNSLGTLAGGIAHEFNNLLMGIQGNLAILQFQNSDPYEQGFLDIIQQIERIIEQSKDLTNQILLFSRQSDFESYQVNAISVLENTLTIFESTKDRRVQTSLVLDHNNQKIVANESQLSQCYLNLLKNSLDAIDDTGVIEIRTYNLTEDDIDLESVVAPRQDLHENYLVIEFRDSGKGISQKNLRRVFDPFFTTKDVGEGTGLGLSLVFRYISNVEGMIALESEVDIGTKVTLYLPVSKVGEDDEMPDHILPEPETINFEEKFRNKIGHAPRILLVDDEIEITDNLKAYLDGNGIRVDVVHDGAIAWEVFQNSKFDVIILDINIPSVSGTELARRIQNKNPEQSIVFISGYSARHIPSNRSHQFIQKPFKYSILLQTLFEIYSSL